MIGLEVDVFFLLYLAAGFLLLFGLWFYYDWRDRQFFRNERARVIFHCIKCGQIYTAPQGTEECDCPSCGFANGPLRF